jgi:hypothetical protein
MDNCIHDITVLGIGLVVGVEADCGVKCLLSFSSVTEGELGLEEPLVNAGEFTIYTDASLAVFDSQFVLLKCNVGGGPI